jgi:hypothetical protein
MNAPDQPWEPDADSLNTRGGRSRDVRVGLPERCDEDDQTLGEERAQVPAFWISCSPPRAVSIASLSLRRSRDGLESS